MIEYLGNQYLVLCVAVVGCVGFCYHKYKHWPKLSDYKLENTIGVGSFGEVNLANENSTGKKVVIKIITRGKLEPTLVSAQIKLLQTVSHRHIANTKYITPFMSKAIEDIPMIIEYGDYGTLETAVITGKLKFREITFLQAKNRTIRIQ